MPSNARGNVDAVAHQVAVALLDHVAEMDAHAELDAPVGRKANIALDHAVLHLDGAPHSVHHAAKLDDAAVASTLDDTSVMQSDGRVDEVASKSPKPRKCPLLVGPRKPAVSDHICRKNGRELPGLWHDTTLDVSKSSTINRSGLVRGLVC